MNKTSILNKKNCKELLIQRMFFAIGSSIMVHFVLMSCIILINKLKITHPLEWIQNTWDVITCLRMWIYFLAFSNVVLLLGIICSKDYINSVPYAISRFVKFCRVFTPHNFLMGSFYTFLGGVLAWLHLSAEGEGYCSLIKNCVQHQGYCLVEEHFFLLLEGFWIGLYFFINTRYMGSRNIQFAIIPQSKLFQIKRGIHAIIISTMLDAFWPVLYYFGLYSMFGNYCKNFIFSPFSLSIEDIPLDKFSRLLSLSLVFYTWLHAVLFILIIQSMHLLFQVYLTEWISFDIENIQFTEKSKVSLSNSLTMEEIPILQKLGYLDLLTIAQKDKTRRSIIFTLSQPGGHPYNWNNIVEKTLLLIKQFSERLSSACTLQKVQIPQVSKTAIISSQVPCKPYIFNMRNLASPGCAAPTAINMENKLIPGKDSIMQYYSNIKNCFVKYLFSKKLISYIFAEQFENKLRYILHDAQTVIWAVDAISSLAAISLNEDLYGIIQKDLPDIIQVLLELKHSLDNIQKLNIAMRKHISDDRYLIQSMSSLRSAVRRSLYRIVLHFKDYIDDLPLHPSILDQLQLFVTYKE